MDVKLVNGENVTLITEEKKEFLFVTYNKETHFDTPFSIDLGYLTFNLNSPTDIRVNAKTIFPTGEARTELKFFIHNCDVPFCLECPYKLVDNTAPCRLCDEGYDIEPSGNCTLRSSLSASASATKAQTAA